MKRGQIATVAPTFLAALIAVILLFSVLLPVSNTALAGNSTTGNVWNNTAYGSALQVAQATPLLYVLLLFVTIAIVAIGFFKGM